MKNLTYEWTMRKKYICIVWDQWCSLKNLTYGWPMSNEYICIVWDHGCSCKTLPMGVPCVMSISVLSGTMGIRVKPYLWVDHA